MLKLKLQSETLQISIYCAIIQNLLEEHRNLSVAKLMVFSYLVKKNRYESNRVYDGRHSTDLMYKSLSLLSGDFRDFSNSINYILKSIHILIAKDVIKFEKNLLHNNLKRDKGKTFYEIDSFLRNSIEASINISDKQFLKEVLSNV